MYLYSGVIRVTKPPSIDNFVQTKPVHTRQRVASNLLAPLPKVWYSVVSVSQISSPSEYCMATHSRAPETSQPSNSSHAFAKTSDTPARI
jgi:hypothetical protein